MLVDEYPEQGMLGPLALNGSPVTIHLYVSDVDATVAQVVAAGATVTMQVAWLTPSVITGRWRRTSATLT